MILTSAAVVAVGLGAYGLGRVYPPMGPSAGTIAPAERYVSSQVGENDVTLGDTAVPELMQTDAFELFLHDPQFRALASSPGFQDLAGRPQLMAMLLSNPRQFADLAANPEAFDGLIKAAELAASKGHQAEDMSAALLGLVAGLYLLANVGASLRTASKTEWRYLPILPVIFGILHISYGSGFLAGLVKFARFWKPSAASTVKRASQV
jgi:hypothetical protein